MNYHLIDILVIRQSNQDFQFLHFHVMWVIIFAEKHLKWIIANINSRPLEINSRPLKINSRTINLLFAEPTLTSPERTPGYFWTISEIFRSATYWISLSADNKVTDWGKYFDQEIFWIDQEIFWRNIWRNFWSLKRYLNQLFIVNQLWDTIWEWERLLKVS